MPIHQHTQPPDEHQPPPCGCPGCLEFRAIHARLCPELPLDQRLTKRATDRAAQRRYEDSEATATTARAAA